MTALPIGSSTEPVVRAVDLVTWLHTPRGPARAVDGISLEVGAGQTLGIVGESGSGKTMLSRSVMGLLPRRSLARLEGTVTYRGDVIDRHDEAALRDLWGREIAMVFQNPLNSLNPVMRVGRQIGETLGHHFDMDRSEQRERALALLRSVGISEAEQRLDAYPHEMSGGMRQRVVIAIALACGPGLLLADEPTTALDVTVQRQVLDLLDDQREQRNMAMVLVTHDLAVVAGRADEVAVVYAGQVVEHARSHDLFTFPRHPYTHALLASIPAFEGTRGGRLEAIEGRPPDLVDPPPGCRFAPRCPRADAVCTASDPDWTVTTDDVGGEHRFRCHHPHETPVELAGFVGKLT